MSAVKRVLVIGAGISGLTLAVALRRQSIDVDVAEIKDDVSQQAGVGLSLQGNCIAALARIGVAADCLKRGMPGNYLNMRRADGTLLARQPVMQTGGPAFPGTAGISRTALHAILLGAAQAAGVRMHMGLSFESFACDEHAVTVRFTDGSSRTYDLMAGADGIYSRTRGLLFPETKPTYCGQAVWRVGVPRPKGNFTTELHFGGPLGVVGICPVSPQLAYLYIVETAAAATRYENSQLADVMVGKLAAYSGEMLREGIAHIAQSDAISYRPLESLLLPDPWYKERVVLIGDAAHSNPPVLAQGAAMGIEDAVVLAEVLVTNAQLDASLKQFMQRRFPRASMVVNNSVKLCEWEVNHTAGPQEVGRIMLETQRALSQPI
jgi:2-polyprenyl-6-methoxyphenol hydroxylase-like FAD-dependent oxidoreductase